MFNLEGLIPTLCELAQGVGTDEMAIYLRAKALQTLSSMVLFSKHLFSYHYPNYYQELNMLVSQHEHAWCFSLHDCSHVYLYLLSVHHLSINFYIFSVEIKH